ncbi:MAG: DHH family phosphoesterase [Myxococcales bacterium]|nr:DHH family phosphoesterase [Myxococcales bacterium]
MANAPFTGRAPAELSRRIVAGLPTRAKIERLVRLAKSRRHGLILTHDNPDPDSLASAAALALLLERKTGLSCEVAFGGIIGRAENIAFVKVLGLPAIPVSEVVFEEHDLIGLVDTQPGQRNHSLPPRYAADVVIDHHPLREEGPVPEYADVGGDFGATSTLLVEYLRAARLEPSVELATALYYGIKADTRDLDRQTTQSDVDAYVWLIPRVDRELLSQIEHPDLPARYFALYHTAIERAKVYGAAVITDLGEVYSPDMVAEVADRMMHLEGMKWSLAHGSFRSQLYLSLRVNDRRMNAGRLVREICEPRGGSAGGHGSMAGARLALSGTRSQRTALRREVIGEFLRAFGAERVRGVSLLSEQARGQ